MARPDLVDRMTDAGNVSLILVSAPAGSGKTTLLAEWVKSLSDGLVAWLALDPEDDRPERFWSYVIAAFRRVAPGIGAGALALLERSPGSIAALTLLVNELESLQDEVHLVLDDYHVIQSVQIHESVSYLLDHLPENVHIVISTRSDPALPLPRLRARGELLEIRVSDLYFTTAETETYMSQLMGLSLAPTQIELLDRRTEGWPAAVQLAALSMRGVEDASSFVSEFAGTERYIVDYLVEEVLSRQPIEVRDFLLRTSILRRLTGGLCDAVTGRGDGAAMLEALERDNLLIVPLDGHRHWYRYHHLFSDVLRAHLSAEGEETVRMLHRRASNWFEANGDMSEAIKHSIAAGHHDHAADLVEFTVPSMRRARDEATMRTWFESLPADIFPDRPVLAVGYVGALLASGSLDGVDELLGIAEGWLDPDDPGRQPVVANADEMRRLPSAVALYRSGQALMSGNADAAITYAGQALERAAPEDHLERGGAAGLLALTHWSRGDLEAAYPSWDTSRAELQMADHASDVAGVSIAMADIRQTQGQLDQALKILEEGLRLATKDGMSRRGTADMHVGMGDILRERNDLDAADQHLAMAQDLGDGNGLPQNLYRSRLLAARIREARGDVGGALELVAEAKHFYFTDFSPDVRPVSAVQARLLLKAGRLDDALRWAEQSGLALSDEPTYINEFSHITLARVVAADRSPGGLGSFLQRLLVSAETGDRTANVIEILVVLALVQHDEKDIDNAVAALVRALVLAQPQRFTRVFLDEGDRILPLLRLVSAREDSPPYAHQVLAAMNEVGQVLTQDLVDPLTERELEVLRLLGTEMSGPDIARELYVSLNTMRSHTKSIYTKLGVGNRRAAVRRATELDLLA